MISVSAEASGDDGFYAALPSFDRFDLVVEPERYSDAPADWLVLITDVRGSTLAIEAGRYKEVNALGVACIIGVLNALPGPELPYVFGGDGATMLLPASSRARVEPALRGLKRLSEARFGLALRVGLVPVGELQSDGYPVRVARYRASEHVCLAMLSGSGLSEAERRIKEPDQGERYGVGEGEEALDLEGFECRWLPLRARRGRILSLLVQALGEGEELQRARYRRVLEEVSAAVGDLKAASPVEAASLALAGRPSAFDVEARLRVAGGAWAVLKEKLRLVWAVGLARLLLWTGRKAGSFDGARYRQEVSENSDFRKFDDTLRMVLDLEPERIVELEGRLQVLADRGEIVFGMHQSEAALMTCMVGSYSGNHVHFIDGADGGYAMAARPMKAMKKGQGPGRAREGQGGSERASPVSLRVPPADTGAEP